MAERVFKKTRCVAKNRMIGFQLMPHITNRYYRNSRDKCKECATLNALDLKEDEQHFYTSHIA